MSNTVVNNPVLWADVPDVDVIRSGNTYYMVSTSMHSMPGCPIMKSEDLAHWEIVSYVFEQLEDNDGHNLANGQNVYSQGSWAASLREHNGTYYVCFSCNDTRKLNVFKTDDIESSNWERHVIDGLRHDPGLLFDDGRVYVIYGNGGIRITELTADATALQPGGVNQLLFETETEGIGLRCEGCHAYKIDGYYYLFFIDWPRVGHGRRRELCYRSTELLGPYEHRVVLDDDMGYHNKGVAQGGIFNTPEGEWYAMLFQDHDAVGRIPCLVPVTWSDGWPVFGDEGRVPVRYEVPLRETSVQPLVISDEFDYDLNRLALNWQWNHNPDPERWSVLERPGYLRLKTGAIAGSVLQARNTLTQRTEGPACTTETLLELSGLQPGDHAGLVAMQNLFGTVGVSVGNDGARLVQMGVNQGDGGEEVVEQVSYDGDRIHLKIHFNFEESIDQASFSYSSDGDTWHAIGRPLEMKYTLDHFMGYRFGLFNYATLQSGGVADFDYLRYTRS